MRDGEPAVAPRGVHDVHRAPVGEPRHREARHGGQGGTVIQRGGKHLARVREEGQVLADSLGLLPRGPLGLVEARALERLRALPRQHHDEVSVLGSEPAVILELQLDPAGRATLDDERHGHGGAASLSAHRRAGEARTPLSR